MSSYVTNRARPSKVIEELKHPRPRSQSPTLADRAVFRISDQRDAVQKKTFTKWVNHHLQKANVTITEMYQDFRDGVNLLLLLELLTDEKLPREKGHLRFHKLQNCQTALNFLNTKQVKVINIHQDDIVDGNSKITLALIWIIILHFQISDIKVIGQVEEMSPKAKLLHWCRRITEGYPQVAVLNFTTSWKDGLAFNAVIHRYRPDLIDLSDLNRNTPEYNVENAFNVAEKELGVPRLLDVEDVVTEHVDEKSVMTYVSSLYETFPRAVASFESSEDEEKVLKYEEYCKLSEELVIWIKRVMIQLESRTFPTTIQGMKDAIQDFDDFYTDEFSRIEESRSQVKSVIRELHLFYGPMSSWLEFPQGCHPRDIEMLWLRLLRCTEERNKTLRAEMTRVRKMYQLADQITHEAEEMETLLPELEEKVSEEERVWDTLDTDIAHERFKNLEVTLKIFEEKLYRIYQNFEYLITGHYQGLEDIRTRIHKIQTRWKVLLSRLSRFNIEPYKRFMRFDTTTVVSPERTTKAHWELEPAVPSEKRQRIASPLKFSSIQKVSKKTLQQHKLPTLDAPLTKSVVYSSQSAPVSHGTQDLDQIREKIETTLNTIKEKQSIVQGAPYGNDLLSVEQQYNDHQNDHEDIMSLREEVEKTCKQTSHDDRIVKDKKTELKRLYSELVISSVHRTRCLRSLLTFMNEATKELIWMNQKEEIETLRDWSDESLEVEEIEKYRTEFKTEMEMHEIEQRSVVGKGEHLLQSGHPAVQSIQAYVTSLRLQWTWIVELFQALEEHLLNAHAYHQFFDEVKENKLWMASKTEELRTNFLEKDNPSRAEIISLWEEFMELKLQLVNRSDRLSSLKLLGKRVVPLKQRGTPVSSDTPVKTVCNYEQMQSEVSQGEKCILLDNSQQQNWRVLTSEGKECEVPSVCFVIPAPNIEAKDYMTSLEIQYKHLLTSWKFKYSSLSRTLATQEVSSSVKVLDFPEKVKLPSIEDVASRDLEQLLKEVEECKDFDLDSSTNDASQPSLVEEPIKSRDALETFAESTTSQPLTYSDNQDKESATDNLLQWVEATEKTLKSKDRHVPLDIDVLNDQLQEIKELQTERLFKREPQYEALQRETLDEPVLAQKYEILQQKWTDTCRRLEKRQKRLELLNIVAELVVDLRRWISSVETILCNQPGMTSKAGDLHKQLKELREIQMEMQPRRERIYQLKQASLKLTSPESDHAVYVITRWEELSTETQSRSAKLQATVDVLETFQRSHETEVVWITQAEELLASDEFLKDSEEFSENRMKRFSDFFSEVRQHGKTIENVVSQEDQYIFDSEDYETTLKNYSRYVNQSSEDSVYEDATRAREEIGNHAESLRTRYAALQLDVENTRDRLLRALQDHGSEHPEIEDETTRWNSSVQRLLDWVESQEESLASQSPPSLDHKELKEQLDRHRKLSKEVLASQQPVENTLRQGRRFLEGHTDHLPASTRSELDTKMVSLEIRWMRLQRESDNRYRRLVVIHDKLSTFEEVLHPFVAWLGRAEKQADAIMTKGSDLDTVQERMERHKDFVSDVKRHEGDLKEVNHHGEVFLHEAKLFQVELENYVTAVEKPELLEGVAKDAQEQSWALENKLSDINERYNRLLILLSEKGSVLNQSWLQLREYHIKVNELLPWLSASEHKLALIMQNPTGKDSEDADSKLSELKSLQTDVHSHHPQVVAIKVASQNLPTPPEGASAKSSPQRKTVPERYDDLVTAMTSFESQLQTTSITTKTVKEDSKNLLKCLVEIKRKLEELGPFQENIEILQNKVLQFKIIQNDINRRRSSVESINELHRKKKVKAKDIKLDQLNNTWREVITLTNTTYTEITTVFVRTLRTFDTWVLTLLKRLETGELLTSDIIVFEENLSKIKKEGDSKRFLLQSVNQSGHELSSMDKDPRRKDSPVVSGLDHVNKNWQALSVQIMNAEYKLTEVREQTKKYNSAKKVVVTWFELIETRLRNLPSFGIDPKSIKKQMTEQQSLQDEAIKYKANIDMLIGIGKVIITITTRPGEELTKRPDLPITRDLQTLNDRYDNIWRNIEKRGIDLETTLSNADKYFTALNEVSKFLDECERTLASQPAIANDLPSIQKQLITTEDLLSKVENFKPIEVVCRNGEELITGREDAPGCKDVQKQLALLRDRHASVLERARARRDRVLGAADRPIADFRNEVRSISVWIQETWNVMSVILSGQGKPKDNKRKLQDIDVENQSMATKMEKMNEDGEILVNFMNSSNQNAQPVSTMMMKLNKAWEEFQEKLKRAKENVNEGKSSKVPIEEMVQPMSVITVQSAPPEEPEASLMTELPGTETNGIRVVTTRTTMTIVVITRHGTTKTLQIPYEEVPAKGEPAADERPFIQFEERIDNNRNPLKVAVSSKRDQPRRQIKVRSYTKYTIIEKGVPRTHLEPSEEVVTLPTDGLHVTNYNPLPEDKVEYSKDKSSKKIRVITRYLTQLSPLDYQIQPNDVLEEYTNSRGKPVRRTVRKLYQENKPVGELVIEEYTDDAGRLVRKVTRRVVVVTTVTERGVKKQRKQPTEELQSEVIDGRAVVKPVLDEDFEQKPDDEGQLVRKAVVKEVFAMPTPSMFSEPMEEGQQYPEQVEEYTDEQGRRVRRVTKKTVIRTTGFAHEHPPEESEEPEERVEEFIDDQGRKVRRIIKRVVRHTRVEEVAPVRESSLESQPFKLQIKPKDRSKSPSPSPDDGQEFGRRVVKKTVVGPLVLPSEMGEDQSEKTEEFVDADGRKVTRVIRKVVTRPSKGPKGPDEEKVSKSPAKPEDAPVELVLPMETGIDVPQEPEFVFSEPESPPPEELVEEYVDQSGRKMKRIIKRTIVVRTVYINGKPERIEEPVDEVHEIPVPDDERPDQATVDERVGVVRLQKRVELPDWEPVEVVHSPPRFQDDEPREEKEPLKPNYATRPYKPSTEELIRPSTVDRSYTFPDILDFDEDEFGVEELSEPFEIEEFVDDDGRLMKRITVRTVVTRKLTVGGVTKDVLEPVEDVTVVPADQFEPALLPKLFNKRVKIEEFVDEKGRKIRRLIKTTVVTKTVTKDGVTDTVQQPINEVEDYPAIETAHPELLPEVFKGQPAEIMEFVDEHDRRVRKTVKRVVVVRDTVAGRRPDVDEQPVEEVCIEPVSDGLEPEEKPRVKEHTEEYTDDQGRLVKRIVRRTIVSRRITKDGVSRMITEPLNEPKETTVSVNTHDKVNPLTFKITTVRKSRVGHVETVPVKSAEHVNVEEPNKVDDFVDDDGRWVRRLTTKKVTTRKVVNGDIGEPEENIIVPGDHLEFRISPDEKGEPVKIEQVTDDDGQKVAKVTRKTLVTRHVTKDGVKTSLSEPVEKVKNMPVLVPREPVPGAQPAVQEYVDEKGRRIKRILRKTTVTKTVTIKGQPVTVEEPAEEYPVMSAMELLQDLEDIPFESLPTDEGIPVEEFTDDKGRLVKVVIVRTIVTRTIIKNGVKTVTKEPKEEIVYVIDGTPVQPESITVDGKPVEPKKPEEIVPSVSDIFAPLEEVPIESLPFDQGTPVEEFTDDQGRVVRVVIVRTIVTRTVIRNGEKTVTKEPKEEVVYIIDGMPVEPESITVDGKPVEPKKPEEIVPSVTEFITPLEEIPIESLPFDQGRPVEEFTDDQGRLVRVVIVRTIVTRTIIRNGEKTVTKEPKEEVVYIIDGMPVEPESITVDGKPVEPKKPEELITPFEEIPIESLPFDQGRPVEEFTDDQGRVVRVVIVRTIVTRTVIRNGEKTVTKEPMEEVVYIIDGKPVEPESIIVDGKPVEPKKPEEIVPSVTEFVTPLEESPFETLPFDQGRPVEEFTDDQGRVVRVVIVRTIVTRTVIRNGEKTVTKEPMEEVVYIIDGKPVEPESITVDGKPVEPKKPEELITPFEEVPIESLPFDQGRPVEEFTDDQGRVVRVVILRTIMTRTVIINGQKTVTKEPMEEVVYIIDGKPVEPENVIVDGKPVQPKKPEEIVPSVSDIFAPLEEVPIESLPFDQGTPVEEFTDDQGRVVRVVIVRTIVTRTVIRNGEKTVTKEPKEEVVYIIDGMPVEPESITVDGKPVEPKKPEEIVPSVTEFITPLEEIPIESLPFDQGRPVEEFTDDQGRLVRVVIVRTIVTRTIIRNGEKTVTKEPKEEVVYIIDGMPVEPESITVDGKPVEPKKPEELITPFEEIPIESLPFDQGRPVEEFTDDQGRVVRVVIVRTIVTRTVIRNGEKTVHKEPMEEVVYIIDGKPVEPESIIVDGKPVEPKKPEEIVPSVTEFVTPLEESPFETLPFDQGRPVEEFTDDQGRVVRVVIVRTIVTRTVIKNGEKTVTKEPMEEVVYIIDGKPVEPESITVDGKPVEPKKPEELITPFEEVPIESLPFDQGRPVEEFTDDQGRVVRVVILRTIMTRTVIINGQKTVTKEPMEEVVYIIDGKPVEPENVIVDGKPVQPKKPEEIVPSLTELITPLEEIPIESLPFDQGTPLEEIPIESLPFDQGRPVEEFTDDQGRVVRVVIVRTIVTRTVIRNGEKTVTKEPKEEVVYIIDGMPVEPESITVDGKPVEPKKPEEIVPSVTEFVTPLEEIPIESLPFDQGTPVEEFTDDQGRVVRVVIVRTIVTRTVIRNGEKTVTKEPKEEVVYIIDGMPVEPESITVDGKPVEPKKPEELITPFEDVPIERLPFDQGRPVEEFTDDQGRVVRVVIVRTIVTRTVIRNGEKTVTKEPMEEVVYIIDGKPVEPESITVDGKPVEPKKPEEIVPSVTEFVTPLEESPFESLPFDQGRPVEEFTDDQGRVVRVVIVRTIVTRTVIRNGEKTVTKEPMEEVVYIIDGKPVEPESITVDGKPVEPKKPEELITPFEEVPIETLPFDQGRPVEEFTDDQGRVVRVVIVRTIVTRTVIKNGEKTVTKEPMEEVVYIIDGKPVEPESITVDGKPVEPKKPEELITPFEEVPIESLPFDQGRPVEEFTDDQGRVVRVVILRTIMTRTVIINGQKTVTKEPMEEVVYIIDGKPVEPENVIVDGKPVQPKKPEEIVPSLTELITPLEEIPIESLPFDQGTPLEEIPIESLPFDQGRPVEEFTDDQGRVVRVVIVRTIVTRTVIRNGEKTVTKEPKEEVVYIIDGMPVEPESITVDGKPVEPKKPEEIVPSVTEFVTPLEEIPIESLPFDQGTPVEEFTDDQGRVVRVVIVRTIVTRTVIRNGEKTVTKEPKEEVVYIIDGMPVEPESITVDGKPVEPKKPEELITPFEDVPIERLPFDQGRPVEEFTDDQGRVVRVVIVRTIVTRTVIRNGEKTVTKEPKEEVVYIIDGMPVEPESITVDGKPVEPKKPEEIVPSVTEFVTPLEEIPIESLPFDQGTPVEEFTDDQGRVVRVVIVRTIVTRTVIRNGEKTVTKEPKEEVVYIIDGMPVEPESITVDGKPVEPKKPEELITPFEDVPIERLPFDQGRPVEEFTDDQGRVVRVVIVRTIVTRTVIRNGEKTVTKEPMEEVVYIIDGKPVEPESITVDGKPVEPKKPEEIVPSVTEFVTPLEESPFESLPFDQGRPVEEFTDDQGRVVRVVIVRTIVTRTVIRNGEKTVTKEPMEEVVYIIDGKPVEPENVIVDGKPVQPKKPEEIVPSLAELITPLEETPFESLPFDQGTPLEEIPIESLPFDQSRPVEEFTDDQGRVVRVVIVRTIVTRTVIRNGEKTVTKEPKEEVVYIIDGMPVKPESITVDGKPVEPKKPEELVTTFEEFPIESLPFDQGTPVEEFTDDQGRVVRVVIVRTIVTRTIIRNGEKTVTKEPKEEVVYIIDGIPVEPESITVDGKPVEPRKPEELITPFEDVPIESLPFDQGRPVEEFTDDQGRVVRVVIVRTIVTRTVIRNGEKTVTKEPMEEVVYIIDGKPVEPESIIVDGKPVEPKKPEEIVPSLAEFITPLEETPFESLPFDQGTPVEEFTDDQGRVVRVVIVRTIVTRTVIRNGEKTVTKEPKEEVVYIIDGKPVEPENVTVDGKPVEPKKLEEIKQMFEPEGEVEEFVDAQGRKVRRIVKKTVITKTITRTGGVELRAQPGADTEPADETQEVEEYIDEQGRRVRRVVTNVLTTRTVTDDGVSEETREPREPGVEPLTEEMPWETVDESVVEGAPEENVEDYVDDEGRRVKRVTKKIVSKKIITKVGEGVYDVEGEVVPKVNGELDHHAEPKRDVATEEFVDEKGRVVRRVTRETVTKRTVTHEGIQEPGADSLQVVPHDDEPYESVSETYEQTKPQEKVEEFIDDDGKLVRRTYRQITTTRRIIREGETVFEDKPADVILEPELTGPEQSVIEFLESFPEPSDDLVPTPDGEVEEFVDEQGRRVRRIVRQTVTTRTVRMSTQPEEKSIVDDLRELDWLLDESLLDVPVSKTVSDVAVENMPSVTTVQFEERFPEEDFKRIDFGTVSVERDVPLETVMDQAVAELEEASQERPEVMLLASPADQHDRVVRRVIITSMVETYSVVIIREIYLRVIHGNSLLAQRIYDSGELTELYEEVLKWMMDMGKKLDNLKPVSGETDVLKNQKKELEELESEVKNYETELGKIFKIGERALEQTSGDEAKEIEDELTDVRTVWYQLTTLLNDRREKIESVEPLAKKYHQALQQLAQVMSKTEATLDKQKLIGAEPERVQEELEKVKAFKGTVQEHETMFENSGWSLIEEHNYSPHHPHSTADMASITEQLTTVKIKVSDLLRKVGAIKGNKEDHLLQAEKYTKNNEELEGHLKDPSTVKEITEPIEKDIHIIKDELSELQGVQDITNDVCRPSLHAVEDSGQWIVSNARTGGRGAEDIATVIEPNITKKKEVLKELDRKISERKDKLHEALTHCRTSEHTLDEVLRWLRANDKAMKALKPMSENMEVLLHLRDFYDNLRNDLFNHEPLYDDAIKWSRDVINKERPGPYRSGLEKKYTEVVTLWRELKMKVRGNLRELGVIIPLARKYHDTVKPVRDVIERVEKLCVDHRPLGSNVEKGRLEIHQMEYLVKSLENCREDVAAMNSNSQELIYTLINYSDATKQIIETSTFLMKRYETLLRAIREMLIQTRQEVEYIVRFYDTLQALERQLIKIAKIVRNTRKRSNDPRITKHYNEQLKAARNALSEIDPQMQSLQSTGIWLLNVNRDNQRYVVDLKTKLSDISEMYGDLVRQSSGLQNNKLSVIQEADDYEDLLEDLCLWLDQKEKFVARQKPLTAKGEELKALVNEQKIFLKDIASNQPLYDDVVEMVLEVVCTTEPSPKRDALEDNVNDAVRRWDILSKNATKRMKQLNRIEPLAVEYENTKHEFFRWLTDTESAIKEVPTDAVDQISLPKYLEQIKDLHEDVRKHKPVHKLYNKVAESLTEACEELKITTATPELTKDVQKTNTRWENLNEELKAKSKKLASSKQGLRDYQDALVPFQETVTKADEVFVSQMAVGLDKEKARKQLDTVKELITTVDTAEEKLVRSARHAPIREKTLDTLAEQRQTRNRLVKQESLLQRHIKTVETFEELIRQLKQWVDEIREKTTAIKESPSEDPEQLNEKLQEVENLLNEMEKLHDTYKTAEQAGHLDY